jgi:hypothetical protein
MAWDFDALHAELRQAAEQMWPGISERLASLNDPSGQLIYSLEATHAWLTAP